MYGHKLRVNGEYLAKGQVVPVNTSTPGNSGPIRAHNTSGGLELQIVAATACTMSAGKTLTVKMLDCDTQTGSFAEIPQRFAATYAGAKTFKAGEVIGVLPLPTTCRQFVKCTLQTDDTAPTGTVDVFAGYNPR